MKLAYLDCIGGIAGDMTLAALIEAGVSENELLDVLRTLPISGWEWRSERVEIEAIYARRVYITHNEDQPHRHLSDVLEIIERGDLPPVVKQRVAAVFTRLAEAEAAVHGTTPDRVHFHEVGAVDAILDVVGACWGFHALGVERIVCSPLPMGRGFVKAAHGALPLPAPAVVELLRGVPTYGIPIQGETVTPTGAALAVALSHRFGQQPPMRWEQIGYGAGHADRPLPNLLRLFVGESTDLLQTPAGDWESIVQIETNLDNATPQQLGYVMERAFAAGALDVFFTPVQMKKNRPGVHLTVLAAPERADALMSLLLRETPTLGVRYSLMNRRCLQRDYLQVETAYGTVRIKRAWDGERVLHLAPEYEDCVALAQQHGAPLHAIMQEALQKARESGD
ncbi:MAG: nickel pincer cofactor biosynthesis protein LarC [Fimbriimonadales bacterium]|nr:nickel pincer cofactor biosynthesis protein LarC [Fimbriimonadales bacterium]